MHSRMLKGALGATALCAALLGGATVQAAEVPLWEVGAGAAVLNAPDYRGSDQRRNWVLPFPYVVYRGEFLRADEQGVRGLFYKSDRTELNLSINGAIPVDSEDNVARRGMPDLDPTLEIGPTLNVVLWRAPDTKRRLELRLPLRAVFATDLSHIHHQGWVFQPNLNFDIKDVLGQPGWNFGLMGGPLFSDRRYNRYLYAVDPAFATATRPTYNVGDGYAGAQVLASISKRYREFWVGGFVRLDTLRGAVFENSPLVQDRNYIAGGVAIAWIFGASKTMVTAESR